MILYHLVAFLVVAIWGTTFVFTKLLLMAGLTAAQIFVLRFIIAYVMLLVYALAKTNFRMFTSTWKDELLMVGLGVTGGSLYFLTENSAMIYTTTTNTSLIVCLCPLFAALFAALFFRSLRLHGIQIVGSVMAAIGVVIVVLNGHFVLHLSPLGDSLAFAACLCWAVYSLLMIPATRRYDTLFITRKVFFYGLLSMVPYFLFRPEMPTLSLLRRPVESVVSGLRSLHVLFHGLELGHEETGSSHGHQLRLFQSRRHRALCLDGPQRAHHHLFPHRHPTHPYRHVFLQ